ncbi:AfsR/SARP family transcriptional regulator [Nonomuraea polychroma]|uniref:AfsR/SARP family transcriptional regulator n=1 Tax=Nonomuraea polychroma TaxID=46176 RepID=UPI003D92831B
MTLDRLSRSIWPEAPLSAAANLRTYAYTLRRHLDRAIPGLGGALKTVRGGYRLSIGGGRLDLHDFDSMTREAEGLVARGRPARAAELYEQALRLWRGKPLDDVSGGPLLLTETAWLEERFAGAIDRAVDLWLAIGANDKVVQVTSRFVHNYPFNERLWERLMLGLFRSGRQVEALEAYTRARTYLVEAAGVEPGPAMRRLQSAILADDPAIFGPGLPT